MLWSNCPRISRRQTGTTMKFEFVPWPNFADRMLNELNSGGKLCDLLIGDSQWIGGSAENGYYVKLNDFFDKEGIKMSDFAPATVYAYSTWPKGTPNYWALPAMGDANGWFYRKDWFANPELAGRIQGEVQPRPGAAEDLGPSSRRRRNSSRAARSTARRSMAPRSSPSVPRKASPWAPPRRSIRTASSTRTRPASTTWRARSTRRTPSRVSRCTRRSTSAAPLRATPTATWVRASTPSNPARSP